MANIKTIYEKLSTKNKTMKEDNWISVKDRLPEDNEWYSVITTGTNQLLSDRMSFDKDVTHWLEPQQRIVLTAEEWESVQNKDAIIKNLELQLIQALSQLK